MGEKQFKERKDSKQKLMQLTTQGVRLHIIQENRTEWMGSSDKMGERGRVGEGRGGV